MNEKGKALKSMYGQGHFGSTVSFRHILKMLPERLHKISGRWQSCHSYVPLGTKTLPNQFAADLGKVIFAR